MNATNATFAPVVSATRQPRTRGLLITSLVLLAVVGAQAISVALAPNSPWTQSVDDAWRSAVGVGPSSGAYTWAVPMFFQQLGQLFTVDHGSFPSGHAVSAGALAVILVALIPAATKAARISVLVIGALLILGMIWQRTLINAHWLSDTIAGVFAGVGVAMLLWWAFEPWLRRDRGRRPRFLKTRTEPTKVSKEQV